MTIQVQKGKNMFSKTNSRKATLALAAIGCFGLLATAACAQTPPAAPAAAAPAPSQDQVLYGLGVALSGQLSAFHLTEAELAQVQKGFSEGALKKGAAATMDMREVMPAIQAFANERMQKAAAAEAGEAEAFLAKKAAEPGAVKTESGLIYKEIKPGTGESPAATDRVKVHYHGTIRTGEVFDSSVERNEPATFPLNQVIPCWTEGLQKMKVGGKAQLVCPSKIAYGEQGRPPKIPGGAALVFEVELLEIVK
jgi:FKBP-type peptidyl-prolyl cis-trans isomerase FkpA